MTLAFLLGMIGLSAKQRAIRRYLTRLPRHLASDYGHRGPYTPAQVERSIERHRISGARFAPYAQAIFCDPQELELRRRKNGAEPDFAALRAEIGGGYFSGDDGFDLKDVAGYGGGHSWGGETSHAGDAGGHHDAGGGGHH